MPVLDRPAPTEAIPAPDDPPAFGRSLRACALALVAAHVLGDGAPPDGPPEARLLGDHLAHFAGDGHVRTDALAGALGRPAPDDAHLVGLALELGLTTIEVLAVALAAAVEDDALTGRVLAWAQAPVGGSRPTLGLLAAAFAATVPAGVHPIHALLTGAAVGTGLLALLGEGAPLPERAVAVPPALCLALGGHDAAGPGETIGVDEATRVPLPPSVLAEARRRADALAGEPVRALTLRTGSPAEGRAVADAIARELGARPLFVEGEPAAGLGPRLRLRGLLPVFCAELGPGERYALPALPGYRGPVLARCGPDGSVTAGGAATPDWSPPVPSRAERQALWGAALGDSDPTLARDLAGGHRHGSGRIAHLGRLARHHRATQGGQGPPGAADVAAAAWTGEGAGLDGLAQPVRHAIPDGALVVPTGLRRELELLLRRCQARDGLEEGLGASIAARYHPGVRALLVGPSGAGKTMAAGWLATRLGLPLYRVDLAAVTSKYIGETEKNLAQLLARAEASEVVLLFDEADSLFGKRTDVKEANDRFANAQTNYLLQRIETFDGIVLLTGNSRTRFDAGFTRRLDLIVEFPLPGPEERRALWTSHLGPGHRLDPGELNRLAALADLGGGHIRNAVLAAAVLARAAPGGGIALDHVLAGLDGEYRKLGRQLPIELRAGG